MNLRVLAAAALLLAASPAFAGVVDGNWTASVDTPNGAVKVNYVFKVDGTKLTGTVTGPNDSLLPIKNGKVDGTMLSFSLDLDFGQGPVTFNYTGVASASEIKLHTDFMGMPLDFLLKRPATP